jgi:hypothetical protein
MCQVTPTKPGKGNKVRTARHHAAERPVAMIFS